MKKMKMFSVMLVVLGLMLVASSVVCAAKFGTPLGNYNGVIAYSNESTKKVSNKYYTVSKYTTGMMWQCVEYANRYYWIKYGKKISGGNANSYYRDASKKGLKRSPNGDRDKPRPGNILVSEGGGYGHVAIVRSVPSTSKPGKYTMYVIQQNYTEDSKDANYPMTLTVSKDKKGNLYYSVSGWGSSYPIKGWLWPK